MVRCARLSESSAVRAAPLGTYSHGRRGGGEEVALLISATEAGEQRRRSRRTVYSILQVCWPDNRTPGGVGMRCL